MKDLKVYALYLPQFHETPENNEWWENGYTDWFAVQNAKPAYNGHTQPRIPLNNNYYDLTNVETLKWQAALAEKYHVNGFCIYHYYSNGQLLMNKPAELILENKDISISFFFSWGNHDFRKTWFNGDGSILRKQTYGGENDFVNHYKYLQTFFKDKRYLKIGNKPVFVIYKVNAIQNYELMMKIWERLLKEDGFDGIFIVAMKCQPSVKNFEYFRYRNVNAIMPFEPLNVRSNAINGNFFYVNKRRAKTVLLRIYNKIFSFNQRPEVFSYKWANKTMLRRKTDCKQFYCTFPEWDNTPRYQGSGVVFSGASSEQFYKYTKKTIERSLDENAELFFVNAWNEWGETAYLEPDTNTGYAKLEALSKAIIDAKNRFYRIGD